MTQPTDSQPPNPQPTPAVPPAQPVTPAQPAVTPTPTPPTSAPVTPPATPVESTDPIQPPEPTPVPTYKSVSIAGISITPAFIRKFLVALLGAAAIAVTQGLINGTAAKWCAIIIGFATALGVHQISNAQPDTG